MKKAITAPVEKSPLIQSMETYAVEHHIPIMDEEGLRTLVTLLSVQKPTHLFEIGTAIGYSAIRLAVAFPNLKITTIERDEVRYLEAINNIQKAGLAHRITCIHQDALTLDIEPYKHQYDALFIDAAKGQYHNFFQHYEEVIHQEGVIYCDNILMSGQTELPLDQIPRRNRTMIRNLQQFILEMHDHPRFDCSILYAGDGVLVAVKKTGENKA